MPGGGAQPSLPSAGGAGAEGEDQLKMQVNDICWSPKTSSVFASVAEDGRVEIWDLHRNNLAPMICHFDLDA